MAGACGRGVSRPRGAPRGGVVGPGRTSDSGVSSGGAARRAALDAHAQARAARAACARACACTHGDAEREGEKERERERETYACLIYAHEYVSPVHLQAPRGLAPDDPLSSKRLL